MNNSTDEKQTRREMCRSLLRYSVIGGLGLLWAGLCVRSEHNAAPSACPGSLSCGGCTQFEKCNLPQAEKAKNELKQLQGVLTHQPEPTDREEER